MFTGQYVHRLSTSLVDPLDETWPTLAEHFRDRGYATAGFTANLRYTSRETGLARGFVHYEDHPVSAEMVLFSSSLVRRLTRVVRRQLGIDQRFVRKHAPEMTDAVLRWLRRAGGRPFFVFVNYYDAHAPYVPPDSLASRFGTRRTGRALADLSTRQHWSAEEIRVERDAHDAMLIYLDGELGRLFDALDARGLAANTIVLVTADHGEQFGEHGLMDHGNSLYEPVLRVPLIVRYPPTIPAGVRVVSRVSLRDIAATVVDVAGQTPSPLPGTSLMPLADDDTAPASPLLSEVREGIRTSPWLPLAKGGMKSLVHDGMHYIREGDGSEQLYDLGADPDELRDLERSGSSHILELLRGLVDSLTSEAVIPR
jgi:arylsulfatase A-like enzyme